MSNLGWYQLLTTVAKKVGGPPKLVGLLLAGGYGIGKVVEIGGKEVLKIIKKRRSEDGDNIASAKSKYKFTIAGRGESGLRFSKGDEFFVAAIHGTVVLIENENDLNSPYFVDLVWLKSVSNYE